MRIIKLGKRFYDIYIQTLYKEKEVLRLGMEVLNCKVLALKRRA